MKKLLITVLLALAISSVTTQVALANAAVDFRQSAMTVFVWYLKPMGGMAKGKIPFDQTAFANNAQGLATATRLDIPAGFPKGSYDEEESDAKPAIWEKWSEFEGKYRDLQKQAAKLAEVAQGGNVAAMKAQFGATAKTCGSCHKPFRSKK